MVFDGAMGTNLQAMNLTSEDFGGARYAGCIDHLLLSKPEAVESVHRSFLEAGADVIETDTFRANRLTLGEFGLEDKVAEINRAAEVGVQISVDLVRGLHNFVHGVYLMPPFGRYDMAAQIIDTIRRDIAPT